MDRTFGPAWNCIVGKGFASAVTYKNRHFIFFYVANKGILIFKYEWYKNSNNLNNYKIIFLILN